MIFLDNGWTGHLGDVGSDQLDISAVGRGAGSAAVLPQQLVLRAKGEVRGGTIDVAQSEATVKILWGVCGV